MTVKGNLAIVGLGITEMGKIYGRPAGDFAAEAMALALEDAGLTKNDVDGLLINANLSPRDGAEPPDRRWASATSRCSTP